MANLITLDDYKTLKEITSDVNNARLDVLITSISQLVKTYCANSFVDFFTSDKTEFLNIDWATNSIQLTEAPVVSITSVEERDNYSSTYIVLTTGAFEYYLDSSTDSVMRTTSTGWKNWPIGPAAVRVIYKAGYESIPEDLKLAVVDLITYYHKEEYKERRTLSGASITNSTTSTQWRNVTFPDHIKRILDLYKQIQT